MKKKKKKIVNMYDNTKSFHVSRWNGKKALDLGRVYMLEIVLSIT